jgi:hypothetical protein
MAKQKEDTLIAQMQEAVERKKKALKAVNEPNVTNMNFGFSDSQSDRQNISVQGIEWVTRALAFLIMMKECWEKSCTILGVKTDFKWLGYSYGDWEKDLLRRVGKITYAEEKQKLEKMEARLEELLSPEAKRQKELEKMSKELLD